MKLIKWVEVHIGRSRRKSKKERDDVENKSSVKMGTEQIQEKPLDLLGTPVHKVEPMRNDFPTTRSAGNTPRRTKQPLSPYIFVGASGTPSTARFANKFEQHQKYKHANFREPLPTIGTLLSIDTGSPRQRSRIRTNPWLPSPRNSRNPQKVQHIESDSSESIAGNGFDSHSGVIWDDQWNVFRVGCRSPLVNRLPRLNLDKSPNRTPSFKEENCHCLGIYNRPIPRSSRIDFRKVSTSLLLADESSDEAYSEDFADEEDQSDTQYDRHSSQDAGSPQADSACGSDRDNSSSCSTTPSSESAISNQPSNITEASEILRDKVQRLQREQQFVHTRVLEAREEEIIRCEEQLVLRREIAQFRRLILLQTLTDLRDQLERHYEKPSVSYNGNFR